MDETASLRTRAFRGVAISVAGIAGALFLPAATLAWWQAWLFLFTYAAAVLAITLYFLKVDPALSARRLRAGPRAESEVSQRIIQTLSGLAFVALLIVSALDRRFGWSGFPAVVSLAGDLLVLLGLAIVFRVFRENSYAFATVTVGRDQPVIATGPYAHVRHPMYAGALVMLLGVPLALGSAWALVPFAVLVVLVAVRLVYEERLLVAGLAGYADYRRKTRARLIPHVW